MADMLTAKLTESVRRMGQGIIARATRARAGLDHDATNPYAEIVETERVKTLARSTPCARANQAGNSQAAAAISIRATERR